MDLWTASITLLLIMNPLGNLPIFISVLRHIEPKRRKVVLARELIFALIFMLLFLYAGTWLLSSLGLRQESVSIAGGIILFIIALRMIFPQPGGVLGLPAGDEPFIVPLAIPLISGPSLLASLILLANQEPERMFDWTVAAGVAWLISATVLMFSSVVMRGLGQRGLNAIERLMGMILIMVAVQMFLDGIMRYVSQGMAG
ncbi:MULTISPECIES: YhgN family NAAT transporter [Gammaproteobacteria]|uniref:YhgN family NAAT transporter n=1 Tax=Gammaproteobacteria TaxID=1236 RepID=UPI000DCFE962|nr:YhgN family NAAT transporter [Aliidiomarina sp. B3213]RTE86521.1 YhgN family NAAT transporter [Aliidiomarina sp. B3213]TCZ90924.1 YhgN family NAAT transporter [Lysobacter sp. N42]